MLDTDHISIDRMLMVVVQCDELMTEGEEEHIQRCRECLMLFGQMVMSNFENDFDIE